MVGYLSQVQSQLEGDLKIISLEESNHLLLAKKSLAVIRECCRKLSTVRLQCDFQSKEEEIYFFKELKCYYYSQLYYHQDIIEIGCGMPNGSHESKQNFLKECLHKLNEHFLHHRYLYTYYRAGRTDKDLHYFSLIMRYDTKLDDDGKEMFCEDDYSCVYDFLYSRVISNDRLERYLHQEITALNGVEKLYGTIISAQIRSKLEWTESKAALVELIYGLHESKCINGGRIGIRELVELVKKLFPNVDLSDYYRTYTDLKNRSKRTIFIDTMKSTLVQRLDKDDEK